jgi:hypothetical protein
MGDGLADLAAGVRDRALEDLRRGAGLAMLPVATPEAGVQLLLLGRPRVVIGGDEWPLALWPAWWRQLVATAISHDLLGEPFPAEEARGVLSACDDAPSRSLETVLHEATQLLRGVTRVPGGLSLHADGVVLSWKGIHGDVRSAFDAARGDAWRHVTGGYLPGVEGDAVEVARRRFTELLRADLAAIRRPLDPEETVFLLAGAGRVLEVRDSALRVAQAAG